VNKTVVISVVVTYMTSCMVAQQMVGNGRVVAIDYCRCVCVVLCCVCVVSGCVCVVLRCVVFALCCVVLCLRCVGLCLRCVALCCVCVVLCCVALCCIVCGQCVSKGTVRYIITVIKQCCTL